MTEVDGTVENQIRVLNRYRINGRQRIRAQKSPQTIRHRHRIDAAPHNDALGCGFATGQAADTYTAEEGSLNRLDLPTAAHLLMENLHQ